MILFLIVFFFVFILAFVAFLFTKLKSLFSSKKNSAQNEGKETTGDSQWDSYNTTSGGNKRDRVMFDKDEGEYVDFEEIKESKN